VSGRNCYLIRYSQVQRARTSCLAVTGGGDGESCAIGFVGGY
jgi:hypothetical protein